MSENKPPSVIAVLVGFYRHSKSPHSFSFIFQSMWGNYYLVERKGDAERNQNVKSELYNAKHADVMQDHFRTTCSPVILCFVVSIEELWQDWDIYLFLNGNITIENVVMHLGICLLCSIISWNLFVNVKAGRNSSHLSLYFAFTICHYCRHLCVVYKSL